MSCARMVKPEVPLNGTSDVSAAQLLFHPGVGLAVRGQRCFVDAVLTDGFDCSRDLIVLRGIGEDRPNGLTARCAVQIRDFAEWVERDLVRILPGGDRTAGEAGAQANCPGHFPPPHRSVKTMAKVEEAHALMKAMLDGDPA